MGVRCEGLKSARGEEADPAKGSPKGVMGDRRGRWGAGDYSKTKYYMPVCLAKMATSVGCGRNQ